MNDSALMSVAHRIAHIPEEIEALGCRQGMAVCVLRDRRAINEFHYEVRTTAIGSSRIKDTRDPRMAHMGERLSLDVEAIEHGTRVHTRLHDFDCDSSMKRRRLLGFEYFAEPPFAEASQNLVLVDFRGVFFRMHTIQNGLDTDLFGCAVVANQFVEFATYCRLAGALQFQIQLPFLRREFDGDIEQSTNTLFVLIGTHFRNSSTHGLGQNRIRHARLPDAILHGMKSPAPQSERFDPGPLRPLALLAAAALIAIAMLRITMTYDALSHTYDEPAHIAAGMELLATRTYQYENLHPPFARMMTALLPWLDGARFGHSAGMYNEGIAILHGRDLYKRELARARLGVLPFFALGALCIWFWGRTIYGDGAALVALLLYTNAPMALAHAGLATTDMIFTSFFIATLFAWNQWLAKPTILRGLFFGLAAGFAIASKFSALFYFPPCAAAVQMWRWWAGERLPTLAVIGRSFAIAGFSVVLVLWGAYGARSFQITTNSDRPHTAFDEKLSLPGPLRSIAYAALELPIPYVPELRNSLSKLEQKTRRGHFSYLLGEIKKSADWRFFPVGLLFKSPLPFLALALIGVGCILRPGARRRDWQGAVPLLCAGMILVLGMASKVNIGLRHVLPIYPLLAIAGGMGTAVIWRQRPRRNLGRLVISVLLLWLGIGSARTHPDYLSYFNELAGRRPEEILVNSDLDWGQDLHRLRDACLAHEIDELTIAYFGRTDLTKHGLAETVRVLEPDTPAKGWVAISLCSLKSRGGGGYRWFEEHEPVARVGASILLYRFEDLTGPGALEDAQ